MGVRRAATVAMAVGLATGGLALAGQPASATISVGFHELTPVRVYDSRDPVAKLAPDVERAITVAGLGGVPSDATRAALRLGVTDGEGFGELRVHACGGYDPNGVVTSPVDNSSYSKLVFAPLSVSGQLCVTSTVAAHLAVDVEGYENASVGGTAFVDIPDAIGTDTTVAAGSVTSVSVAALGVRAGASTVSLSVQAEAALAGLVEVWSCDDARPLYATLGLRGNNRRSFTGEISAVGASRTICVYASTQAHVVVNVEGYWMLNASATPAGPAQYGYRAVRAPGLVAVTPRRLLDTRESGVPVGAGSAYVLDLTSQVPDTTTDVVMNVTVTETHGPGFVTVYPCQDEQPTASNLNYVAGQTVPNLVTVSVGTDRRVCLYTQAAAHLVADLAGYYVVGGGDGLVPTTPSRLFDTRDGARIAGGGVHELDLTGKVSPDATAVVMNVTATDPLLPGFVTVYPCSAGQPTASNLNFVARQTVPNLVTVALAPDHRVCFYSNAPTHLLADLSGWYAPSSPVGYFGETPSRAFDTRETSDTLAAGDVVGFTFGPGVAPGPDRVSAVVLNITAVDPVGAGFLTAYPCAAGRPTASNVNFVAGQVVPNLAIVSVDADDAVCFYAHNGTDVVVDVAGSFTEIRDLLPVITT